MGAVPKVIVPYWDLPWSFVGRDLDSKGLNPSDLIKHEPVKPRLAIRGPDGSAAVPAACGALQGLNALSGSGSN